MEDINFNGFKKGFQAKTRKEYPARIHFELHDIIKEIQKQCTNQGMLTSFPAASAYLAKEIKKQGFKPVVRIEIGEFHSKNANKRRPKLL